MMVDYARFRIEGRRLWASVRRTGRILVFGFAPPLILYILTMFFGEAIRDYAGAISQLGTRLVRGVLPGGGDLPRPDTTSTDPCELKVVLRYLDADVQDSTTDSTTFQVNAADLTETFRSKALSIAVLNPCKQKVDVRVKFRVSAPSWYKFRPHVYPCPQGFLNDECWEIGVIDGHNYVERIGLPCLVRNALRRDESGSGVEFTIYLLISDLKKRTHYLAQHFDFKVVGDIGGTDILCAN